MSGLFDEHLSLDVVVAYADGEMSLTAYQRAAAHVMQCGPCAADVAEQTAASQYLRQAQVPTMPGSLFEALRSIPVALPAAGLVAGLVLDAESGQARRSPEDNGHHRSRRFRIGAGALVAGIAMGAVVVASGADQASFNPPGPVHPDNAAVSRPSSPESSSIRATPPTAIPAPVVPATVIDVMARSSRATR